MTILEDPTNYIVQYSEKTKYSCVLLGVSLFLVILFFISPLSVSSGSISSWIMKLVVIGLLIATSTILFNAVRPIIDTKGIIETDLFPDLKYNFFVTIGFIMIIVVLGIVVIRL
jgi:succinate dehydrogenase/fumarate reductase cytochrome b subunit